MSYERQRSGRALFGGATYRSLAQAYQMQNKNENENKNKRETKRNEREFISVRNFARGLCKICKDSKRWAGTGSINKNK